MHSFHFLLLVALLAAVVLAIPTPTRTTKSAGLRKRTFKVPRHPNPRVRRTGDAAIAKAFRKYGWSRNVTTSQQSTAGVNENGEVAALPQENEAFFLSPVKVGGQTLHLDFDTGSSDFWVFSTELSQDQIGQHTAFDPAKSSTFEELSGNTFLIKYGDGSGAAGIVGFDTVDIGGSSVTKQAIEMATAVSSSFVQDVNNDGLVGLAFSKLNTVSPNQQKTFFDNIMADLEQPLFTADLTNDTSGTYEFGTIDQTKFKGDLTWIPVDASSGFWQFESSTFQINGQTFRNTASAPAIADTGTSLLLVDQNVAEAYYSQVKGASLDTSGNFVYPCDAKLPDFGVAIGSNYMATVPGSEITFAALDTANQTCFGGIQGNSGSDLQIFGDTMFKAQFVVFHGGNKSLGFAPKN